MQDEDVVRRILEKRSAHQPENYADGFNIVMLGTSGVGKTVFMTAMLNELLRGQYGFSLEPCEPIGSAVPATTKKQLLLEDYSRLCKGEELPATARHNEWRFKVFHKGTYLFTFRWIDYRGGSIDPQNVSAENPMDLTRIVKFLRAEGTVAALVLADAERFEREPEKVKADLGFAREVLVQAYSDQLKRGLHLVLTLTKVDSVALKNNFLWRSWDRGRISHLCHQVFDELFQPYVQQHPGTDCFVIPVSAYGKSATQDGNGRMQIQRSTSALQSFQIHAPLVAAFRSILEHIRLKIPYAKEDARNDREKASEDYYSLSWWRRLWGAGSQEAQTIRTCDELLRHLQTMDSRISTLLERTQGLQPEVYYPLR